ncbi:MAG: N-acetylglutaminylglutamine synthetase [Hyphomicrobiaceae bacterium]
MTETKRQTSERLHQLQRRNSSSKSDHGELGGEASHAGEASIDCGWGRLVFAQTFDSDERLAELLRAEGPDRRDIAFYVRDPHVTLAAAPQELFLDPSHTYRLELPKYRSVHKRRRGFLVRRLTTREDAEAVNVIYAKRGMVPVPPDFFWSKRTARSLIVMVAEDAETGEIVGTAMGVDHAYAFEDPEKGSSLWCLAVSPQARHGGIGEELVRRLADHFKARGAGFMDLSVLHDNEQAIALYDKLGFERVPVFAVKRRNPINEPLFTGPAEDEQLNVYAKIIVNEARRRGISVEVTDAEGGLFRLTYGGRSVHCRESLSEFTSAVAMSICDDKRVTRRIVQSAGVRVPAQLTVSDREQREAFLKKHGSVVVKPARGEQGRGIAVGVSNSEDVEAAVERARIVCEDVLLEEYFKGEDLRLVVIDYKVVAAAVRRPACVTGDGRSSIREMVEVQSRRRAAATNGESRIPLDAETERCVREAGYDLDAILPEGTELQVRKTANLHTGGTIHDVTATTHRSLLDAAIAAARAIEIPVTGIDFMVKSPSLPDYVFIEANERPGLANHEPQPTAERFVDLLFPLSIPQAVRTLQRRQAT